MALATPLFLCTHNFSIYNAGWNGCSDIAVKTYELGVLQPTFYFETSELEPVHQSFVEYELEPINSTVLIIGPSAVFTQAEADYLKNFVESGGMLLLADDFGTGNDLLGKMNASSRFSGELLLDLSFEKNTSFVVIFDFIDRSHLLVTNVSHILLNYPTSISSAGDNASILAVSTKISWLDKNLNDKEDVGEPRGSFPVLVTEKHGLGEIILFSGPSLLINSMNGQLGNKVFRDNLFHYLYDGRDAVIIDEAHRNIATPWTLAYVFPETVGADVKISILLLICVAFMLVFTDGPKRMYRWLMKLARRKDAAEADEAGKMDELVDEVMTKHPGWSRHRLEKLVSEMIE
jgi:hypothetical protein